MACQGDTNGVQQKTSLPDPISVVNFDEPSSFEDDPLQTVYGNVPFKVIR